MIKGHLICFDLSRPRSPMPKLADALLCALSKPSRPPLSSFFLMEKGYFDDMTELNVQGQELMKPKLRPGGADTSEACQKQDRRWEKGHLEI